MARPKKDELDKRTRMVQARVSPREETVFLTRATESGHEPAAYARAVLCGATRSASTPSRKEDFELVDMLMRLGGDVQMIRAILERTGVPPASLEALCDKVDLALDKVLER